MCVWGGGVATRCENTAPPRPINECRTGFNVYLETDLMTGPDTITDVADNFKLSPVVSSEISK